ncbi:hypothetical protein WG899_16715 [Paucibacter sp. AS339]
MLLLKAEARWLHADLDVAEAQARELIQQALSLSDGCMRLVNPS